MKKYTWVKHFENWNNRGYSLHDNESGKNVAWIGENNYCDYTISASDYPMAEYRYPHPLREAMQACLKTAGIDSDDVEEYAE